MPDTAHPQLGVNQLQLRQLSVSLAGTSVLQGIDLDLQQAQVTAIIGPSGCGKTTLLRTMNRMVELLPRVRIQGQVCLNGDDIYRPSVEVAELRRQIGMVFQKPNPFPKSIFENVAFALRLHGLTNKRQLQDVVELSLRNAALWDEVKDRLHGSALSLSLGQQQRLMIARALAVSPTVLLLDEPASSLDPISTLKIEELIQELKQSLLIVLVTHNMQQAARVADRTVFMLQGQIVEQGLTEQLFTLPQSRLTEDYITGRYG